MGVEETPSQFAALQLGVWRVLIAESNLKLPGKDSFSVFPLLLAFVVEIYSLAPDLVICFVLTKVWSGVQSSLILRTSNHLLTVVSVDHLIIS